MTDRPELQGKRHLPPQPSEGQRLSKNARKFKKKIEEHAVKVVESKRFPLTSITKTGLLFKNTGLMRLNYKRCLFQR